MKLIEFCASAVARAWPLTLLLASALFLSAPAAAQSLPSVRIGTASLISPSAANTYYAGASGAPANINRQTATPAEVTELARALRNDPDLIYDYVRNTIDITWIYGLQRGSLGAIIDRSGTSFDQARLMVDLLLAAGHSSARYRHGTITLTGSQFEAWSGLTSATAACQLLSSGGIPAIINGSTTADCNYGSASLTTITVAHVWVSVSIGGTTYYFDPSYKAHDVNAGVANLNSAAGLTAGAPLTEASSGMNSGTDSGVTWVQALDSEDLDDLVQTYAGTLQTYIQNNLPDGDMDDLVGGATITRADGQVRQTSYGDSGATTWTAVPDQYRAMLGVHITHEPDGAGPQVEMFDYTFFADEIYGRRLLVETNFRNGESWANIENFVATLRLRDARNNAVDIDTYTLNDHYPTVREGVIELEANHPYAANSGAYMDRVVTRPIEMVIPLVILHGWGDVSPGLQAAWGPFQDLPLPYVPPRGCDACGRPLSANGQSGREQMGASWLAQSTRAAQIHAEIANAIYTHHHSLGVVNADVEIQSILLNPSDPPSPWNPWRYAVENNFNRLDVDIGFSLTSRAGSSGASSRRATIHAIAATTEALQGSGAAQISDVPDTSSTATRFAWGNAPPASEDFSSTKQPRRFYRFTDANASAASSLVLFEGQTSTVNGPVHFAGEPVIGNAEMQVWRDQLIDTIGLYADADFEVVAGQDAFLGPGQRAGPFEFYDVDLQHRNRFTHEPTMQRGGAFVATRYADGEPVEIAHVTVGHDLIAKGGGGGVQVDNQATYDPSTAADVLRTRFVDRSEALGVDLRTGAATYASPATLRVGNGGFPYELSASLIWRGGQENDERFGEVSHTEPQTPWTTNWNNTLTVSGSGFEAMGQTDVRASASTVAAFLAMQDIYSASVSNQRDTAGPLVAAWWVRGLSGNVVTVNVGADTRQFLRRADGNWFSPGASGYATLTQTGSREIEATYLGSCENNPQDPMYATSRGWNYSDVSFVVTNANGDTQSFPYWERFTLEGTDGCAHLHGWRMTEWSFPQGIDIELEYANSGPFTHEELVEVSNSLGRRIVFVESGRGGFNNGLTAGDFREVTVARAGDVTTHTDPAGAATRIDHDIVSEQHMLNEVFDANDTTTPSLRYNYDTLLRVMEARDAEALQGTRDPYEFRIAQNARGEREDPLGHRFTVLYNSEVRPFRFIDEIGRITSAHYDGRGRPTRYIYPELDEERIVYDDRNNTTELRRTAKPGSGLSDLVITASWNSTWNKPDWIIDARGYRTNFTYGSSGASAGQILTATRPAPSGSTPVGSGTRPVYSFTYGAFGRVATSEDPTGLVVSNAYNGTNGNLNSTTLDPSGINATTSFTYDAQGDTLTTTDPRGNVTSTSYDAMRRPTLVRNHNGNAAAALIGAQRTNYNLLGQVTSIEGGTAFSGTNVTAWQTTETRTYTPTGQVATTINGAGNTTTNAYDGLDRVLSVTDPVSRVTRNEYDGAGQLLRIIRAYGSALQQDYARYTYSANGQRLSVRDANNNRSAYVYDGFDRLCRLYFPVATLGANAANTGGIAENALTCSSGGTNPDYEGYGYDANGNRTSLRLRSGETIAYTFDNLNRETIKDVPGGTAADVYASYDLAGRRTSSRFVSSGGSGVIYGYDSAGRLTSETSFGRALSFQYDLASNRTRLTWPDSAYVTYSYDALNRVDLVRESGATTLADYNYDALGRRATLTRGNGSVTSFDYDLASRLTELDHNLGGSANDQIYGFDYTPASQLSERTTSNDAYSWITPAVARTYTRNGLNQYTATTGTGAASFSYDLRGNLINDGSRRFCFDLENRLLGVAPVANDPCTTPSTLELTYDPLGRLNSSEAATTTEFLYDGDALSAEYVSSAIARRYVHGPGVDEPIVWYEGSNFSDRRYLVADRQGSVIASEGSTTTRYTYGPYGEPASWSGPRFRYTGQAALPEAQLYHYKARVYDPILGRFLQTDPVGYEADINLYGYAANDPANRSDPSGTDFRGGCANGGGMGSSRCIPSLQSQGGSGSSTDRRDSRFRQALQPQDDGWSVSGYSESEAVFGTESGHESAGWYVNFAEGTVWLGGLTVERKAVGLDGGAGLGVALIQGTPEGRSSSAEIDLPIPLLDDLVPVGASFEAGQSESGAPFVAMETGFSMPGSAGNIGNNDTTITSRTDIVGMIMDLPNLIQRSVNAQIGGRP